MTIRFQDFARGTITICDGAWGTEFQKLGAKLGVCTDEWNLTKPHLVEQVARSYVEAGSRVILTNTFRANPIWLEPYGLRAQCEAINRAGVRISREAAGKEALVFASMGPCGRQAGVKEAPVEQWKTTFSEQARALASEGPDAILLETFADLDEARIAAAAALETGLSVVASFFFDPRRDPRRAIAAITPEIVAATMTSDGVHGVGANCGFRVRDFVSHCKRIADACPLPIWIKPNAGLPKIVDGAATYRMTAAEFAEFVPEFVEAGATFLGGCCGTTPEFVRELAQHPALKETGGKAAG